MKKKRQTKAQKPQNREARTQTVTSREPEQWKPAKWSNLGWWVLLAMVGALHLTYWPGYHRDLIRLDDWQFISPLGSLTLSDYFTSWMWAPDKLAFPVRDVTYLFDFWVYSATGYRSFVATSTGIFMLYLAVLRRVLRFYIPERLILPCLAVVALHPLSVEVLHWVISRKHLLVGLSAGIYLLQVESIRQKPDKPAGRLWVATVAYACGILSHPTGVFLPLFALIRLRGSVSRPILWVHSGATGAVAILWLGLTSWINRDYGGLFTKQSIDAGGIDRVITYGVMAIGRAFYQLFIPISQAIYRDPYRLEHGVGLIVMAGWGLFLWSQSRRGDAGREALMTRWTLGSLALLLFLPQFMFVVRRTEFAMADRFLFLSLPYFVALTSSMISSWLTKRQPRAHSALCGVLLVFLFFAAIQTRRVLPLWDSAEGVFRHCIARADSEQCWWHLSDELFRRGCADLMRDEQAFSVKLASLQGNKPSLFTNEGYFRLAVCVGTATSAGPDIKEQFLEQYEQNGARPESLAFARSLVALERGDRRGALNQVIRVYGGGRADIKAFTMMMLGIEEGLLEGICVSGDGSDRHCAEVTAEFAHRYGANPLESRFTDFGRQAAIEAWMRRPGTGD